MLKHGVRSTYSQCPLQLLMYDDSGLISTGTAFFFVYNEKWFIVTNWHNISGKHFLTKTPLLQNRFPTYIKAKISSYLSTGEKPTDNVFEIIAQRIEIYIDRKPVWYEHPQLGSRCDVVVIPLDRPGCCPDCMHNAANLISKTRIPVKPGNSCFIIGFPKSLSSAFGLPLWKSGYIASEPYFPVTIGGKVSENGGLAEGTVLPAFFLDSKTREGMSGSPVFSSYIGNWDLTDPYAPLNPDEKGFWSRDDVAIGENRMEFVGCYSARIGKEEEGAAFGLCWTVETIEKICESKILGKHPHIDVDT